MARRRPRDVPMLLGVAMSKRDAQSFLRKVANDDSFRRRLRNDPAGTLNRAGVMIPEELLPEKIHLPTKDEMKKFLATGVSWRCPGPAFSWCISWALLYAIAARAKPGRTARS
jgi:hypothetical protein